MEKLNEFYIGWKDDLPGSSKAKIKIFLLAVFSLMVMVAVFYVPTQNKFANSVYDVGNTTEYEGYLFKDPVPMLVTIDKEGKRESILLVGYGKFGAIKTIENWEEENKKQLDKILVKLSGTKISYHGQKLLELTDEDDFVKWTDENQTRGRESMELHEVSLTGEIVDPKCYFGAMKPGYGKVHRSCAIRCLSGGIPPVLIDDEGKDHIILLPENTPVSSLFGTVSKRVNVKGKSLVIDSQLYIRITSESVEQIAQKYPVLLDQYVTYCTH